MGGRRVPAEVSCPARATVCAQNWATELKPTAAEIAGRVDAAATTRAARTGTE
jgi:hypothetical protein